MYTYYFVLFKFPNFIPSQYINRTDSINISGEGRISNVQALANWFLFFFFWGGGGGGVNSENNVCQKLSNEHSK